MGLSSLDLLLWWWAEGGTGAELGTSSIFQLQPGEPLKFETCAALRECLGSERSLKVRRMKVQVCPWSVGTLLLAHASLKLDTKQGQRIVYSKAHWKAEWIPKARCKARTLKLSILKTPALGGMSQANNPCRIPVFVESFW